MRRPALPAATVRPERAQPPPMRQMAIERSASPARAPPAPPAPTAPPAPRETRFITLEHGEHRDSTLYRFEKGCRLQFCPGPSLFGRKVFLYTNYVITDDAEGRGEQAEFVRNQYYGLEWRAAAAAGWGAEAEADGEGEADGETEGEALGAGALVTDADLYCEVTLRRAGSFHYYFVYDTAESPVGPQGSGWFGVAPTLPGGVPLDALACQTVLAKCLGPLPRWERTLRVAREAGYNMVHFTPVQELGASGSGYSIANQLRVNPAFGADVTFADVENVVSKMRTEWGMLSICDVVLNHTANETAWLEAHPEATYNCADCPHLRPAALLDALLARLSARAARGELEPRGVPPAVHTHEHIEAVRQVLASELVPEARLHEMYCCDVDYLVRQFCGAARNKVPAAGGGDGGEGAGAGGAGEELRLVQDPQYRRLRASVDMELALRLYNVHRAECADEEARLARCCDALRRALERLNEAAAEEVRGHLRAAVDNACAGMRYERLQADGPRVREVSARRPLVPPYFTWPPGAEARSAAELEALLYGAEGARCRAHNGWVMGADPLEDFAARAAAGRVYLRRELVAWGDSVKLRYGAAPADSPFLWAHMRAYVELTAELFDGLRLDNCHSTPPHVAEYMVDCARNVRPDLYVLAELFTDSDHVDNIFVNRLGITSLVREAQSAWDAREAGRLVHRFGGRGVGAFLRAPRRAAAPRVAHAMLLDLTHDNPSPLDRRSALDAVPCAALAAMACCASGSTRGYDELVPHHVHVVDEGRLYAEWAEGEGEPPVAVRADTGIVAAKRALNRLHGELARDGYREVYVDQVDDDVVAVTRHHPETRKSVILVAFTAFKEPDPATGGRRDVRALRFEGELEGVALEVSVRRRPDAPHYEPHAHYINGLREYEARVVRDVPPERAASVARVRREGALTCVEWGELLPGGVVALRVAPRAEAAAALAALHRALAAPPREDAFRLAAPLAALDLLDANALLYRCEAEEREATGGAAGVYDVPGWGPLPYAGLQGVVSLLAEVTPGDDLAHPLCENLRAGDWLAEYAAARLAREPRLAAVGARVEEALRPLRRLPRYLVPAYFAATVRALHAAAARAALARLGARRAGSLRRALALTSVQLTGAVASAPLPPPSPALSPRPARMASLSAGLPHFAVGYMRCWGRDTFIALRGLFLLTGRFEEARLHLLGFGACLRHGLIPNLLDGGRSARYNCRDAVWWWLHAIKQYVEAAPGGAALLAEPVARLFPADDAAPQPAGAHDQPLHDVMQEALDVHFQGLSFRERRAGRDIDAHMADKGFNVTIGVDPDTGFVFGGNDANAGTWMDKMGSSEAAGTRGVPATPRDGSAVELVALSYAVVAWLAAQHRAARYPYPGVVRRHRDGALTSWTWRQWADRVRAHFERHFWVPPEPSAADARPDLVHRRAIYKDSHGASRPWADYQLRCNFPVAMAVAPELFEPRRAWRALDAVERLLLGPLGVKTLDPADWAYRPDYDNSNDSADPAVAHGYNYHQGPEWTWPLFFYLRARLAFAHECGEHARTVARAFAALGAPLAEIRSSVWRGLPELTNGGGAYCRDACRTQAWSSAAALEALHDLHEARRARTLGD